jgi:Gram-negative bacterial TonB protein C-terminal
VFEAETYMNIGPFVQTVQEPYAAPSIGRLLGATPDDACLLELHTDAGLLYVRPTGWQRIRLRWIFRHFHVLPPQLLSRSDQRLIEKLSHSARVSPSLPVPRSTIFGVVENVRSKSDRAVVSSGAPAKSKAPERRLHVVPQVVQEDLREGVRTIRFPRWLGAAATISAVGLIVYGLFTLPIHQKKAPVVSVPSVQAAPPIHPAAEIAKAAPVPPEPTVVSRISAPVSHLRKAMINALPAAAPAPAPAAVRAAAAAPEPAPATATSIAPAPASPRLFIAELPPGHLVRPVLSDPKLTGQLDLRALIAADGSVKEVALVSGDPKLAQAAMGAVRRWRYAPNPSSAPDGERETLIRMNFFGKDAVSITAVAR